MSTNDGWTERAARVDEDGEVCGVAAPVDEPDVKRVPVDYRYDALNVDFIHMLAEIAAYADGKYGAAENYVDAELRGDKSPVNHMYEHLREYCKGSPYDHFEGSPARHLAAIAYNAMMEYHYFMRRGEDVRVNPVNRPGSLPSWSTNNTGTR